MYKIIKDIFFFLLDLQIRTQFLFVRFFASNFLSKNQGVIVIYSDVIRFSCCLYYTPHTFLPKTYINKNMSLQLVTRNNLQFPLLWFRTNIHEISKKSHEIVQETSNKSYVHHQCMWKQRLILITNLIEISNSMGNTKFVYHSIEL